jgi:phage-related minor tail protein
MQIRRIPIALIAALVVLAGVAAGCGGSDKPAYSSKVDDFQSAFDDLKGLDVKSEGPDAVVSAAKKVKTTGEAAVSAVKSDFGPQANALKSSLQALGESARQLPDTEKRKAALARIPDELDAVSTAFTDLKKKTDKKCD